MKNIIFLSVILLGLCSCSKNQQSKPITDFELNKLYGNYKFTIHYEHFFMSYDSKVEESKLIVRDYMTIGKVIKADLEDQFFVHWGNDTIGSTFEVYSPTKIQYVDEKYDYKYIPARDPDYFFSADSIHFILYNTSSNETWIVKGSKLE